ncbi:hypothetical protein ACFE04_000526 [Oxalis oulophora]
MEPILVFSKILTESDFSEGLFFATQELLDHVIPFSPEVAADPTSLHIEVVDVDHRIWQLGSGWSGRCLEAVRWLNFVRANNLNVGDIIKLYTSNNQNLRESGRRKAARKFRIRIKRPIDLEYVRVIFGEAIVCV